MARTAIEGGCNAIAGAAEADTNGYGKVTILYVATAASASVAITEGDTSGSLAAAEDGAVIDPSTGAAPTLTGIASGKTGIVSYIGNCRYVKATGTNATVIVLLSEPRMSD